MTTSTETPLAALRVAIGARLRDLRKAAEISQHAGAEAAGITQASLSNYENGHRAIPLETALALLAAYGVDDVGALLTREIYDAALRVSGTAWPTCWACGYLITDPEYQAGPKGPEHLNACPLPASR